MGQLRKTRTGGTTRSDAVAVESLLRRHLHTFPDRFFTRFLCIQCGPEPPRSLLVHLGPRRYAVNGHKEQLLWPDLSEEVLDIVENCDEHLFLCHSEGRRVRVLVGAIVDDTI